MINAYKEKEKVLICEFCGCEESPESIEVDHLEKGYWCEVCDGYNYLHEKQQKHRFTIILEDKASRNVIMPNPDISLHKRLSPLRYPGGKSKLINYIYSKLQKEATKTLVGAYAGGASAELALLDAGIIDDLVLNDVDYGIYSLFSIIKNSPQRLIEQIKSTLPNHEEFFLSRKTIDDNFADCSMFDAAWATLIVNRLSYSGISMANPLGGRQGDQKTLLSRWNPNELIKRINRIYKMRDRITVLNMDACQVIEEYYWRPQTTIFLDPPYINKGKQLYRCSYEQEDHEKLNILLESLYHGFPGADIILCYDNDPFIDEAYTLPIIEKVSRIYSI
ncbi:MULTISPECIES: DNA adenine methylase [Bacillota]|uniref:DNA adenine methylase n=1 Tax=Bacillota TaxID=1239 RepID=UPI0039EEF1A5